MGKLAFVFSGQGAQRPGMGKPFYDASDAVKALFDAAEASRPGTLEQCFDGPEAQLQQTANTQPCLYLADLAASLYLRAAGLEPDSVAGFSLGEIPALAFAGAFSYIDGFRIAAERGRLMGEASEKNPASMFAVLKLSDSAVSEICEKLTGAWAVNFNAPGQVVVSCVKDTDAALSEAVKAAGGKAVPLKVSGGFHCPLMQSAAEGFSDALKDFKIAPPRLPVYANSTGKPYVGSPGDLMRAQIINPVRWSELIENMISDGFDSFVECGVGTTLKGLISRIAPECRAYAVSDTLSAETVLAEVQGIA